MFPNIDFEYNLVFVNIFFAVKTIFPDIVHYCCQMKWVYFIRFVSRPYRDAGLVVALSRHCEDSVLLYRVMQGRVPVGTLALRQSCHGTARTLSSCTVLCKVSSLSGRWSITALRGLCPLVPCYARSRPWQDAGLSRHCEDSVLLYRVMQGRVPVGTNRHSLLFRWTPQTIGDCRQVAFAFWKVKKEVKFTFAKVKKMQK